MPQKNIDPFADVPAALNAGFNPYLGLLREAGATSSLPLVFGKALQTYPGQWRERIAAYHGQTQTAQRLVIEIGCYKGLTLVAMAKAYPDTAFIGIDITFKRVVMTAQRIAEAGVRNALCILANATAIDQLFAPGELDGCLVFYPDPWLRKKRQAKNRLVDPGFCTRLHSRLAADGFCWLKTDQEGYFTRARDALDGAHFELRPPPPGSLIAGDFTSTFEQRFAEQNLPSYAGKWFKSSQLPTSLEHAKLTGLA